MESRCDALERWIGHSLLALAARFSIAGIFFMSGRTKVEGWLAVRDSAVALFADEYKVPLLPPELAAHLATYVEHLFPVLLVLGLFTRRSALALLGMTAVIQIFVYPAAWATQLSWAGLLLHLVGRGGGVASLDQARASTCREDRRRQRLVRGPVKGGESAGERRTHGGCQVPRGWPFA